MDDDDEWMPEKLEKQLEVFKRSEKTGLVYSGFFNLSSKKEMIDKYVPSRRGDLSKDILVCNTIISPTSSLVVRRKCLEEAGLFDVKMPSHQDYDICIRLCQICEVDFVKEPLVKYHNHRGTRISNTNNMQRYEISISLIEEKYKDLIQALDKKSRKQREFNKYCTLSSCKDDRKKRINYCKKALAVKFNFKIFAKLCFIYMGIYNFDGIKCYLQRIGMGRLVNWVKNEQI